MKQGSVVPLLPVLLGLAACGGRDPVDTPVNWWHQLQGGVIAEQRPPPPGVDAPYPHLGTTPAAAPTVASADLRRSLTEQLEQQRNLSARLNAESPLPPPGPPAPPKLSAPAAAKAPPNASANGATAPAPANQSSATLDAVEAPPNPAVPPAAAAAPAAHAAVPAADNDAAEVALPELAPGTVPVPAAPIPPIAQTPPGAPALPGLVPVAVPSYAPVSHPNFDLRDAKGELLFFPRGSDALDPGQDGTLRTLAAHRHGGTLVVHGFGDASSDLPADQAAAVALASLRARSVAAALQRDGVPADAIRITADAFGRGARAELID